MQDERLSHGIKFKQTVYTQGDNCNFPNRENTHIRKIFLYSDFPLSTSPRLVTIVMSSVLLRSRLPGCLRNDKAGLREAEVPSWSSKGRFARHTTEIYSAICLPVSNLDGHIDEGRNLKGFDMRHRYIAVKQDLAYALALL